MLKLNLQLFSDPDPVVSNGGYASYLNTGNIDPASMATRANVGTAYVDASGNPITGILGDLSTEMKMTYSQYLIKDVGPNLVHAQFLDEEPLPAHGGDTIEWRKWEDFTKKTTPLVEGQTPEPSKISANHIHAKVNQYGDWSLLTDRVQLETIDNTLVEFTEKHSQNAKKTLDTITREKMISGCTNKVYAGGAEYIYEVSGTITPADVARIRIYLENNNAPTIGEDYVCIIHPTVSFDLLVNHNEWIDIVKYNHAVQIFKGEIGKLYGVRFVKSTEAKIVKAKKLGTGTAAATGVKVLSYNSTTHVATVAANSFVADELNSTTVMVHDVSDTSKTTVAEMTVSDTGTDSITFSAEASFTIAAGDIIYSKESALDGKDYFVCLFLGKNVGKRVAIGSENAQMIIKPVGSAGAGDPLNQRGSVGWKVNGYTAAITNPAYIFAYYCTSAITGVAAND